MCIEPPRPAVRALVLAHQLGEHPERVEALGEAVAVAAVGGRDHVRGAEWPARADGRRLLPDRQVHEARVPHRRGTARRRAPRTRGSGASAGASRGGRQSVNMEVCIVLIGTNLGTGRRCRPDRDPASFAGCGRDAKRVVITGASRGSVGCSRRSRAARWRWWPDGADLKAVAAEPGPPRAQRRRDRRGVQRSGRRCHRRRMGRRRRLDLQRGDLAHRGRPARPTRRSGGSSRGEPHGAFLGPPQRVMREGGRLIFTGSVLGSGREGARAYRRRRPGSSAWQLASISPPASP